MHSFSHPKHNNIINMPEIQMNFKYTNKYFLPNILIFCQRIIIAPIT